MRRAGVLFVVALVAVVTAACGRSNAAGPGTADGGLRVVATVAPVTSIVAAVAGERSQVTGIVPEGRDSHTFEPAPSVAEVLAGADAVFVNGLSLDDAVAGLARKVTRRGAALVALGDRVLPESEYIFDFSFPRDQGRPNPHLWTDPTYARRYAVAVRDTLSGLDPAAAGVYAANESAFSAAADRLDAAMRKAFDSVPGERRKLLTYHDAYAYFARSYDWKVIGAIQVRNFDEPSPKEVAALIDQVKREAVPAIFGSEVFPSPVLAEIGRAAGVSYVDSLRDDDLPGEPGDPEHSWLGLMRFNYATIVRALGGDPSPLTDLDIAGGPPERARYPQ